MLNVTFQETAKDSQSVQFAHQLKFTLSAVELGIINNARLGVSKFNQLLGCRPPPPPLHSERMCVNSLLESIRVDTLNFGLKCVPLQRAGNGESSISKPFLCA